MAHPLAGEPFGKLRAVSPSNGAGVRGPPVEGGETIKPILRGQGLSRNDFLDPPDDAALQAHLDAVGVRTRFREDIPDDALRQPFRELIRLPDHPGAGTSPDIHAIPAIHALTLI